MPNLVPATLVRTRFSRNVPGPLASESLVKQASKEDALVFPRASNQNLYDGAHLQSIKSPMLFLWTLTFSFLFWYICGVLGTLRKVIIKWWYGLLWSQTFLLSLTSVPTDCVPFNTHQAEIKNLKVDGACSRKKKYPWVSHQWDLNSSKTPLCLHDGGQHEWNPYFWDL